MFHVGVESMKLLLIMNRCRWFVIASPRSYRERISVVSASTKDFKRQQMAWTRWNWMSWNVTLKVNRFASDRSIEMEQKKNNDCWLPKALDNLTEEEKRLSIPDRMSVALKHAGVSITVTSVTDVAAFAIGTSTVTISSLYTSILVLNSIV